MMSFKTMAAVIFAAGIMGFSAAAAEQTSTADNAAVSAQTAGKKCAKCRGGACARQNAASAEKCVKCADTKCRDANCGSCQCGKQAAPKKCAKCREAKAE